MLSPDIAARVAELEAAGKCRGDAVGIARWEADHADDPNPYWTDDDNDEEHDHG